ncbi:MAG: zf-HC2 domain-containing protein [Bryobacteraceae bacterium]|jgi:hypothetical protein
MNCATVQNSLSAHLDGCLPKEERERVSLHVARCGGCQSRLEELARVRAAVRSLPAEAVPAKVTTALRVMASKERARVAARQGQFGLLTGRLRLWADNLMRPLALPFAGGFVSAVALFAILIPNFAFHPIVGNDVPFGLSTEPAFKGQLPFGFDSDTADFVVEVVVDGQGRMADFAVVQGPSLANNPGLKRLIERKLLFTEFTPATLFGRPTSGKMYISFQRQQVNVKS